MSYVKAPEVYLGPVHDWGAGNGTFDIIGPKGKAGTLVDYGFMNPTEAFNSVTTEGLIAIGTVADPDAYGEEFPALDLADDAGGVTVLSRHGGVPSSIDDYILNNGRIPADGVIRATLTAPTGGTPTGIAQPFIKIRWDD